MKGSEIVTHVLKELYFLRVSFTIELTSSIRV